MALNGYTESECIEKLHELNIKSYSNLIGQNVYYVKKSYGVHKVIAWDNFKEMYLLDLDGERFYSSIFSIYINL